MDFEFLSRSVTPRAGRSLSRGGTGHAFCSCCFCFGVSPGEAQAREGQCKEPVGDSG